MRWNIPFRLDLRRALLAIGGGACVAASVFYFTVERQRAQEQAELDAQKGFGWETRTGSIVMVPLVGENCRDLAFNNDDGSIFEGAPASCEEILVRWNKTPKKTSHIGAVSENFRK